MYKKLILHSLLFFLISSVVLSPVFAELEFESGPLEQKPLDEREQEDQDVMDVWIYAIIIVVILLIGRLGLELSKNEELRKKINVLPIRQNNLHINHHVLLALLASLIHVFYNLKLKIFGKICLTLFYIYSKDASLQ